MTDYDIEARKAGRPAARGGGGGRLIAAAAGFVVFDLATAFLPNLASSPLPLPDDPVEQARAWYAENGLAAALTGVAQFLSVLCLGVFVVGLVAVSRTARQRSAARTARPWGLAAVGLMMLSSVLGWLLAAVAADASLGTVSALRTANFVTGGTLHVVALGIFVLLASRIPGFGKRIRVFAYVAAVPALVSVVSLVWFNGSVVHPARPAAVHDLDRRRGSQREPPSQPRRPSLSRGKIHRRRILGRTFAAGRADPGAGLNRGRSGVGFDHRVRAGEDDGLVSVLVPDEVGRPSVAPPHLDDLDQMVCMTDGAAMDAKPISHLCSHDPPPSAAPVSLLRSAPARKPAVRLQPRSWMVGSARLPASPLAEPGRRRTEVDPSVLDTGRGTSATGSTVPP